jgi:hypothetical protein
VTYLKIMLDAFNGAGKYKAQIAREAGIDDLTLRHYLRGTYIVPAHRREGREGASRTACPGPEGARCPKEARQGTAGTNPRPCPCPCPEGPKAPCAPGKAARSAFLRNPDH